MTATNTHAASNGTINIPRRGMMRVQFGDDGCVFTFDVMDAWDQWTDLSNQFTYDEKGKLEEGKLQEWTTVRRNFVLELLGRSLPQTPPAGAVPGTLAVPELTKAEVGEFMKFLQEQVDALALFFRPLSAAPPSSQPSTDIRFAQ